MTEEQKECALKALGYAPADWLSLFPFGGSCSQEDDMQVVTSWRDRVLSRSSKWGLEEREAVCHLLESVSDCAADSICERRLLADGLQQLSMELASEYCQRLN